MGCDQTELHQPSNLSIRNLVIQRARGGPEPNLHPWHYNIVPTIYVLSRNMKISKFYLKNFSFRWWNFQYIWIGMFSLWFSWRFYSLSHSVLSGAPWRSAVAVLLCLFVRLLFIPQWSIAVGTINCVKYFFYVWINLLFVKIWYIGWILKHLLQRRRAPICIPAHLTPLLKGIHFKRKEFAPLCPYGSKLFPFKVNFF